MHIKPYTHILNFQHIIRIYISKVYICYICLWKVSLVIIYIYIKSILAKLNWDHNSSINSFGVLLHVFMEEGSDWDNHFLLPIVIFYCFSCSFTFLEAIIKINHPFCTRSDDRAIIILFISSSKKEVIDECQLGVWGNIIQGICQLASSFR